MASKWMTRDQADRRRELMAKQKNEGGESNRTLVTLDGGGQVITMTPDKECKHSVRYRCDDKDKDKAFVDGVYLTRDAFKGKEVPPTISVTVEVGK